MGGGPRGGPGSRAVNDQDWALLPAFLVPPEVAEIFGVDRRTVVRWTENGMFDPEAFFKTPGGRLRFDREAVRTIYEENFESGVVEWARQAEEGGGAEGEGTEAGDPTEAGEAGQER